MSKECRTTWCPHNDKRLKGSCLADKDRLEHCLMRDSKPFKGGKQK